MKGKRLDKQQSTYLTSLIETLCDCQFAFIHYIDDLLNSTVYPCQCVLEERAPVEIYHLTADKRFNNSVFLQNNTELEYYFGLPLNTSTGDILGTLCVYKKQIKGLTSTQKSSLNKVAALASDLMEASFSRTQYIQDLSERDKKLVQLFEQAKEPLMTLEPPNWCFSSGNPAALKLFKVRSEEEFIQLGPWAVSPEFQPDGSRSEDKAKTVVMKALAQGSHSFLWTHKSLDGKEFPSSVFLNRIVEGKRQYLHASVKDISEQKQLENKLQNQLAINESILNSSNEGILLVDHKSRKIQSYNNQFLTMWKVPQALMDSYDDNKIINHVLDQLIAPTVFLDIVEKLYQTPHQDSLDTLLFIDDKVIERYSTPYIFDNEVKGRIWFFRDVTEIRAMEKLVNQSSRLASIGQLAAGIGHEINNPLTIIKAYLARIIDKSDQVPAEILKGLNVLMGASKRIENIVTGLRSFANIEKSSLSDTFNLSTLFFELENMLKSMYLNDGVQLEFDYEGLADSTSINGNRGKFEQILINLIANAKDSTEGMKHRVIEVVVKNEFNQVIVSISDNGCGIAEDIKDKIFDPFFTTKEVGKGTGIGLSLVYRFITDEFNGAINVKKSGIGDGCCFDLNLPISLNQQERSNKVKTPSNHPLTTPRIKLTVIIAEDEEHIRELLTDVLTLAGVKVFSCENGALALQEYLNNAPLYDLIISDIKMPIMDGLTLLDEIRSRVDLKQPKFFFTTGGINIDFKNTNNPWIKTIDAYFYKPFNLSDIHNQLEKSFPLAFPKGIQ